MRNSLNQLFSAAMACFLMIGNTAFAQDSNTPHSCAELNAWYVEPAQGQNAAPVWAEGFEAMEYKSVRGLPWIGDESFPDLGQPIPPKMIAALESMVSRNEKAFECFQRAATFKQCRYPIDFSAGWNTKLPHLSKIKWGSQFLALRGLWQASTGAGDDAGESLLILLALNRSLEEEPTMISQMVRYATTQHLRKSLEHILNRFVLPLATNERLAKEIAQLEEIERTGNHCCRALIGERVNMADFATLSKEERVKFIDDLFYDNKDGPLARSLKTFEPRDSAFLDKALESARSLWLSSDGSRTNIQVDLASRMAEAAKSNFPYSTNILSQLQNSLLLEARALARLRLAKTALALERYRAAHLNVYPPLLSDLVPKYLDTVPVDPFDGRQIKYRRVRKGYAMESAGVSNKLIGFSLSPELDPNAASKERIAFTVINPPINAGK